ncbi:hypothetical protein MHYP_G00261770 [Metynnis hypsauchen]
MNLVLPFCGRRSNHLTKPPNTENKHIQTPSTTKRQQQQQHRTVPTRKRRQRAWQHFACYASKVPSAKASQPGNPHSPNQAPGAFRVPAGTSAASPRSGLCPCSGCALRPQWDARLHLHGHRLHWHSGRTPHSSQCQVWWQQQGCSSQPPYGSTLPLTPVDPAVGDYPELDVGPLPAVWCATVREQAWPQQGYRQAHADERSDPSACGSWLIDGFYVPSSCITSPPVTLLPLAWEPLAPPRIQQQQHFPFKEGEAERPV